MILDFDFDQVMKLSNIKRWGIVEMSRPQSVAEHSFNVAIICKVLAEKIGLCDGAQINLLAWALMHDLPEVVTGDIPSPLKQFRPTTFIDLEKEMFPKYDYLKQKISTDGLAHIVKVADYVDAIQFARKFCIDARKEAIISEMLLRLAIVIDVVEVTHRKTIKNSVDSWLDLKTI